MMRICGALQCTANVSALSPPPIFDHTSSSVCPHVGQEKDLQEVANLNTGELIGNTPGFLSS